MTNASFNVTIINDTLLEYNETFNLTIVIQDMLPITHGKIYQNEVTIINDGGSSKYVISLICGEYVLMLGSMKTAMLSLCSTYVCYVKLSSLVITRLIVARNVLL